MYNKDLDLARLLSQRTSNGGDKAVERAQQDHVARARALIDRAGEFTLQRLILVRSAALTNERSLGFGLVGYTSKGEASIGDTVSELDFSR